MRALQQATCTIPLVAISKDMRRGRTGRLARPSWRRHHRDQSFRLSSPASGSGVVIVAVPSVRKCRRLFAGKSRFPQGGT